MPVNPINGTDEDDSILGTQHRDLILAGLGDDWVVTMGGHDITFGEGGNDTVFGYFGAELLYGGDGDDQLVTSNFDITSLGRIYGGDGNDRIFAGDLKDHSYGGAGDDVISVYIRDGGAAHGGSGIDTLVVNLFGQPDARVVAVATGSDAAVFVGTSSLAISGFEVLRITSGSADDYVRGGDLGDSVDVGSGANIVLGLGGDDVITYRSGAANFLDGGDGTDTLQVIQTLRLGALVLTVSGTNATDANGSELRHFENYAAFGGNGADLVRFGAGKDSFVGYRGDDSCQGGGGADAMAGNGGDDLLAGDYGADRLNGGSGTDTMTGGRGADAFVFDALDRAGDLITDFTSGADQIVIRSQALGGAVADGAVDAGLLHVAVASGTGGQFVLRASATAGASDLIWDANGSDDAGETLIATLSGAPVLVASDILIL